MTALNPRSRALRRCFAALLATVAVGLVACGGDDDSGASGAAGTTGGEGSAEAANIALFVALQANPYEKSVIDSAKKTAAEHGAKLAVFDANNDPQKQVSACDDALATQRYNAFVIKAVAPPTMVNCARQAVDKGIKVVALDSPLGPDSGVVEPQVDGIVGSILTIPATYGKVTGELTEEACAGKDPCNVAHVYGPAAFDFVASGRKSFLDYLKAKPNIKVVASGSADFSGDKAISLTKQFLQNNPDITVIASDDDVQALGAYKAVKEAAKTDDITIIGGGGSKLGVDAIKAGQLFGTTALLPATEAKLAVEMAIKAVRGENVGKNAVNVQTDVIEDPAITKDNVDSFRPEW